MTHHDEGHYAAKYPPGASPDPRIAEGLQAKLLDGKISCAAAHQIAKELQVTPADVGKTIDLLEIRINKCQLGLFGYAPQKKIVQPAAQVSSELRKAITEAMDEKGLSCKAVWEIADRCKVSRLDVSAACEALEVKISSCQLGTFGG